jgi:hypothetical protein
VERSKFIILMRKKEQVDRTHCGIRHLDLPKMFFGTADLRDRLRSGNMVDERMIRFAALPANRIKTRQSRGS